MSFLRPGAAHGYRRHQKPRDQQCSALQQLSGEQHCALLLPQAGEKEQGEEEEVDQGGHRHTEQLPVSHHRHFELQIPFAPCLILSTFFTP